MRPRFPQTQSQFYPMQGGLDLATPAIAIKPGYLFDSQNYEPHVSGGYRRINGFERFDGQDSPSAAYYWVISATITGTVTTGATLTGATSGATGKVLGTYSGVIVLGRVTGTYVSGENLQISAVTVAVSTTAAVRDGAPAPSDHADYKLLAADDLRADITTVTGSGMIRGGFVYNDVCYVFRDNVGGTAGDLYKETSSGWTQVALGREIQFVQRSGTFTITIASPGVATFNNHGFANNQAVILSTTGALPTGLTAGTTYYVRNRAADTFQLSATSGGSSINTSGSQSGTHTVTLVGSAVAVGDVVTGATSGATATVKAALLRTGTWTSSPVGTLVFASVTGTFQSGEALRVSGNAMVQAGGADTAITRAPAGKVVTVTTNFTGAASTTRIYGADGVNLAFEFDGTTYVPIRTGMTTDTPKHIAAHKGRLFLSFGSELQFSGVLDPYAWSVLTGANIIGLGDTITGMLVLTGNTSGASLAVFGEDRTHVLYGSSSSDFNLVPSAADLGYSAYTAQMVGNDSYGLTARGIQSLITTLNYGDFQYASISALIQPLLEAKQAAGVLPTASVTLRAKNQYRVYFDDDSCLVVGLTGGKVNGILPLDYGMTVQCVWGGTLSTGEEVCFFGSDDGYVYKDNTGTSFDGDTIKAWIRPAFNNLQSPQVRKQYRRAVFEVKSDGYADVQIGYDLGYGTRDVSVAVNLDQELTGPGAYWSQTGVTWGGSHVWGAPMVSNASISIEGTETNIGFLFYSDRAQDDPHIVQGITLLYTPRRLVRSGT